MDALLPEGVRSQFLGPLREWVLSHTRKEWDGIHDSFWMLVQELIEDEPGTYEELPDWMTEVAIELLEQNDVH